jgi:dipeptidyl aminopeptidase/acylaminoacyl peptidase
MKLINVLVLLLSLTLQISGQTDGTVIQDKQDQDKDEGQLLPGKNLIVDGVPKVPKELGSIYDGVEGSSYELLGWSDERSEMRVLERWPDPTIYAISSPGEKGKALPNIRPKEGTVYDYYFDRKGKNLIYNVDVKGNELFQFYFYDAHTQKSIILTDGKSRNVEPIWSHRGDYVVWGATPEGETGMELHLCDPFHPQNLKRLVPSSGTPLEAFDWSPDDSHIIYVEYLSLRNDSRLWLVNVSTGKKELLAPLNAKDNAYYGSPVFSADGRHIFLITDQDSEFRRLAILDLSSKKIKFLTKNLNWDVEKMVLSPDGKLLAFETNEDGVSKLHIYNVKTDTIIAKLDSPPGVIFKLAWHNNSNDLAFSLESPRTMGDIYVFNVESGKMVCWSKANLTGLNSEDIQVPELIHYKSFDGRVISGFIYRPTRRVGKLPVLIEIHGGPEDQFRPKFNFVDHTFINKLGIAKIYPNVRGSSGYGKTFLKLDNGVRRKDALKDIEYLLNWIKEQPDLDGDKVVITGQSYGGYMSLLVAANYSSKIRGAISRSGPTNLVSFLENTTGWRRDLRRAEYGDERDPKIRDELNKVAPRNNIDNITAPILIFQGMNDPRVPFGESSDMVQQLKSKGRKVWYVLAKNEGHGFIYGDNGLFRDCVTILFLKQFFEK